MHSGEGESPNVTFPLIKQSENAKTLQRYATILSRTAEDGVSMEDLDALQQDFERLLSTCAVRNRMLRSEVESIDRVEEKREKKGKFIEKQSLKRKRPDDKLRYRDGKNGVRVFKPKHNNFFMNSFMNDLQHKHEVPKVTLPRNDTSDKFWSSIEPYCAELSRDDVNFLDDLIQECSQDINVKIPEAGEHYAMEWAESTINQEQVLSNVGKSPKSKTMTYNNDLKKNGTNALVDTFSSPLTQRLLAALLEEKVIKSFPSAFDKLKASDFSIKNSNGGRGGVCLDRRLRKELVEQGILDVEDLPKTYPPDDDILLEIKKCQEELSVVNEHNISELNKLRTIVAKDLRRQEVKNALGKVDNDIMSMYNNWLTYFECDEEANRLIKQQSVLHRELAELTDFSLIQ
ncbi:hypothetical protein Trydic_g10760 [Trypoxylus dichotomus]